MPKSPLLKRKASIPKILYWGGRPGAKELIPQNSNYRAGIWLTDSIKVAASFGREIYRVEVTGLNNPFIVDAQGEFYAEIPTPPEMVSEGFTFLDTCDSDLIVQFALQRGHDSVIIKNVVEGFSGGGVGLSHQSGTDYVLLKEGQGKIVSSFDYKSTLDAWGMPKDPKFSAASKKAETAYTDEDLEEWLADLHVDPVEGGTVPMTAADKVARPDQWDTPEFKSWFGGSKVVDSKGKPMRVYHGTAAEFDAFKEDFVGQNFGANRLDRVASVISPASVPTRSRMPMMSRLGLSLNRRREGAGAARPGVRAGVAGGEGLSNNAMPAPGVPCRAPAAGARRRTRE